MPRGRTRDGTREAKESLFEKLITIERLTFRAVGKTAFVLLFLAIIFVGMTSDALLVAALAGVVLFVWASVALPLDAIRNFGEYLWSGDAGSDAYSVWCRIIPGRDSGTDRKKGRGRGQADAATLLLALTLTICLVLAIAFVGTATGVFAGVAAATDDTDSDPDTEECGTEVVYADFNEDDELIQEVNETGEADTIRKNTRVTIEEDSGFYRVRTENPNSYCVDMTVKVSDEILPAADLGMVDSLNGDVEARWVDVHDFDRQTAYTEITYEAPPESEFAFAPSKPTVVLPAWRDSHKREAEGLVDRVRNFEPFGDDDVEKRTYTIEVDDSRYATIPLKNLDNEAETIDDYHAVYRVDDEPWKPVTTSTEDPVFKEELDDGERLRFTFNDRDAEVEFTANPGMRDTMRNEIRSFRRNLHDAASFLPTTIGTDAPPAMLELATEAETGAGTEAEVTP